MTKKTQTPEEAKAVAAEILAKLTTEQLVECWENTKPVSECPDAATVRGWYMDALELRDEAAFLEWLESNEDSPRRFFVK